MDCDEKQHRAGSGFSRVQGMGMKTRDFLMPTSPPAVAQNVVVMAGGYGSLGTKMGLSSAKDGSRHHQHVVTCMNAVGAKLRAEDLNIHGEDIGHCGRDFKSIRHGYYLFFSELA
ncbi:hypothetical protein [Janthinobacterium sp. 64]|uniref:hypothetical protein n=1 Tax=Janthinobacterium sp. 64 TaxID=2035208 RepID=UPI000C2C0613|nr:hypothetical protein [Janthinobacterium sp. 64]PKB20157.1 hypothetical protein CLU91_0491 [Janthinobacterium sp. 64]